MSEHFLVDFKREARLAHRLEHPNILPIRDASFIADRFVIAMPLGERSLASRMRRRLSTDSALQLIEQALAAVAHAHTRERHSLRHQARQLHFVPGQPAQAHGLRFLEGRASAR